MDDVGADTDTDAVIAFDRVGTGGSMPRPMPMLGILFDRRMISFNRVALLRAPHRLKTMRVEEQSMPRRIDSTRIP